MTTCRQTQRTTRFLLAVTAAGVGVVGCRYVTGGTHGSGDGDCFSAPRQDGATIARVADTSLTVEQLEAQIRALGPAAVRRYSRPEPLRRYVDDQIRLELLVRAALERGLARDPDVIDAARKVMVRKLLEHDFGPSVFVDAVREGAIEAYYSRHRDDYAKAEARRLAHIQLAPTEQGKAVAYTLGEDIRASSEPARQLAALAARHSLDTSTRANGGELPYSTEQELSARFGPTFASAVFGMDPGTVVAEPVQSTRGWHVVRLISAREALLRPLDEVRDEIRDKLLQSHRTAKFGDYLARIKKRHPVALYAKGLKALEQRFREPSDD